MDWRTERDWEDGGRVTLLTAEQENRALKPPATAERRPADQMDWTGLDWTGPDRTGPGISQLQMNLSAVFPSPSCPAEAALSPSLSVLILISCFYLGNVVKLSRQQQLPVPGSDLKPTKTTHSPLPPCCGCGTRPAAGGPWRAPPWNHRRRESAVSTQAHALSGRVSKQHTGVSDETVADTEIKCGRNRK